MTSVISTLLGASDPRASAAGNPLDDRYYQRDGGGRMSAAGVTVSPELAMKVSAVYRCVAIRAATAAMFPLGVYEQLEKGRRRAKDHPLDRTLSYAPNDRQTSFEFRRQLNVSLLLRQNAYAQIFQKGTELQLIPLHPDRVRGPFETSGGELRYTFTRKSGEPVNLLGGIDIWHLKGLSEDGLKGMAMVDLAGDSIGLAAAAERHAARFYERGMKISGVLQHDKTLDPKTADEMGASFRRKWGGEYGVGGVPVLWDGMKFQPVHMSHKDAEFLDSRRFSVGDIARWFGVPPHMIGDVERSTSWGTGIESQGLQFLIYTLQPDLELWEQSIRHVLLRDPERFYAKHNVSAILRTDSKTQMEVFTQAINAGIFSPNECRELLDRNPREGGDEYLTPMNMRQGSDPAPAEEEPPNEEPEEEEDDDGGANALARRLEAEARASDAAATRVRTLARACARAALERETADVQSIQARSGGRDLSKLQHTLSSFYGRHAAYLSETLGVTQDAARAYCRERLEQLAGNGTKPTTFSISLERLEALALEG